MKSAMSSGVVLVFIELLIAMSTFNISFCNGSTSVGCIESERKALSSFKGDVKDPSNRLASWNIADKDCCKWAGIVCDNFTGHVLQIHLRNPFIFYQNYEEREDYVRSMIAGKINPSLLDLKHLVYLDLSGNNFSEIHQIPRFLSSMTNLRYLNLSDCQFDGVIPPQLGNLSNLRYLDLSLNSALYVENLNWVSGLSLLKHLDLSNVNFEKAYDRLLDINALPHLVVLRLSNSLLHHFPLLPIANFSSLATLDLKSNNFQGPIPDGFQNFTSLRYLDLSWNYFNSSIPNWFNRFSHLEYLSLSYNSLRGTAFGNIGNLTCLQNLDLSYNFKLEGKIPASFQRLCNLKSMSLPKVNLSQEISEILDIFSGCISVGIEALYLTNTQISGPIPLSLGEFSSLKILDFSSNKLNGTLSEIHFSNLSSLESFDVSENSIKLEVSRDWIPPFQLNNLGLRSCLLGPRFPLWLSSQNNLSYIDMSNSSIVDRIPNWFWKSSPIYYLNLSHNKIHGTISNLTTSITYFDLSSNNFSVPLPIVSTNGVVDLSNNAFFGSVFHFFCNDRKELIPSGLNFENNFLSGELPDCWSNWQNLQVLNLGNNQITGILPNSIGFLRNLLSLHLQRNILRGTIPVSFQNCSRLEVLDLSENEFTGYVPTWIGKSLTSLKVLNIRSNNFRGLLPLELCHLGDLQILDLADNNLSGSIPRCVNNFSAMVTAAGGFSSTSLSYFFPSRIEDVLLVMKGHAAEYSTILNLVRSIDLSTNNFSGEIPMELTNLAALQSFNLSHNSFTGILPESIGAMKSLESIDLSANQLSSKIPESISNLTFLSYLNLSNNKLTGEIPSGTQLQGFDPSCFMGNELCGLPLPNKCNQTVTKSDGEDGEENDGTENEVDYWMYVSMAIGFVMGFWGVVCPLFISRRWRCTYYSFLNQLWDKFCIAVVRRCY